MQTSTIERIIKIASGCAEVIRRRIAEISDLQNYLDRLNGNTCTGREWWRDKDHPTKTPKLYILHSIDQTCPLHGEPEPGKRLRVYIGSDPVNVAEARAAIERTHEKKHLEGRLDNITHGLTSCGYHLDRFYGVLGYTGEDDGTLVSR